MDALPYLKKIQLLRDKIEDPAQYPFNLPVIENFEEMSFHKAVTFIVGENGSGKSTLIEAIAVLMGLNAEEGSKNFNFSSHATHSTLYECLRPVRGTGRALDSYFLRAESFYNVATQIEGLGVSGYGDRPIHEQSHGESFWALLRNRLRGKGFYVFDEPEAALSPTRQMAMLTRIHDLVRMKSQFIIATHSPILLAYPDAYIYEIRDGLLCRVDYEQTEHYQITKAFLNNYQDHLDILFEDD